MCGVVWEKSSFVGWNNNLNFWEDWNDRVSSYQTFNFSGHRVTFHQNTNFGGASMWTTNNEEIQNLSEWSFGGVNMNDTFSSARINY